MFLEIIIVNTKFEKMCKNPKCERSMLESQAGGLLETIKSESNKKVLFCQKNKTFHYVSSKN